MGKKKEIIRPESYALNEFSAGHLSLLHDRLKKFIEIMRPAFKDAEKRVYYAETKDSWEHSTADDKDRYRSPAELLEWLEKRAEKLEAFAFKLPPKDAVLEGDDLKNVRQIRAFFIRFSNIAKKSYGHEGLFKAEANEVHALLSQNLVPAQRKGGIFDILRFVLKDEDFDSRADLGKIRKTMSVGGTIKDTLTSFKQLSFEKFKSKMGETVAPPPTPKVKAAQVEQPEFGLAFEIKPIEAKKPRWHKQKPSRASSSGQSSLDLS